MPSVVEPSSIGRGCHAAHKGRGTLPRSTTRRIDYHTRNHAVLLRAPALAPRCCAVLEENGVAA
jgi:hypothetical protein